MNFLDKDRIIKLVYRYFSPHTSDTATRAPQVRHRQKSLAWSLLFIKHQQIIKTNSRNDINLCLQQKIVAKEPFIHPDNKFK